MTDVRLTNQHVKASNHDIKMFSDQSHGIFQDQSLKFAFLSNIKYIGSWYEANI